MISKNLIAGVVVLVAFAASVSAQPIVLEGEKMVATATASAGIVKAVKRPAPWSQKAQLLWATKSVPEKLKLRFRCVKPGKYRLQARYARGPRYGTFRTCFNGKALPGLFVGHAPAHAPHNRDHGIVEVKKGVNTIAIMLLRPGCAKRRIFVGVDRFVLRPVRRVGPWIKARTAQ